MRTIDISITKARIKNVYIVYKEGEKLPQVNAGIQLLTETGEPITTYDIDTHSYDDKKKFELPARLIEPIKIILMGLEGVVAKHCNERMKLLQSVEIKRGKDA